VKRAILRCLACFILGSLAGATALSLKLGQEIERLTYKTRIQQDELAGATRELNRLKASLEARQKRRVRNIDVKIVLNGNLTEIEKQGIEIELEKELEKRLSVLLERELSTLNYWLIPGMVNDRVIQVDGRDFELHVDTVVVAETLGVVVRARPRKASPAPVP